MQDKIMLIITRPRPAGGAKEFKRSDPFLLKALKKDGWMGKIGKVELPTVERGPAMTNADRHHIAGLCLKWGFQRILITHEPDMICKTAEVIQAFAKTTQTIVLAAGNSPDTVFPKFFYALGVCEVLSSGVYISMDTVYPWNRYKQHPKTGILEVLST